jgi:hypothetical protein
MAADFTGVLNPAQRNAMALLEPTVDLRSAFSSCLDDVCRQRIHVAEVRASVASSAYSVSQANDAIKKCMLRSSLFDVAAVGVSVADK